LEWFSLDLAAMDDIVLADHYEKDPSLKDYQAYIEEERRFKDHNLAKDVERALTVRNPWMGTRNVVSFFDKERSLMRFQLKEGDDPVNMEVLLSSLGSSKDAAVRLKCMQELNTGLGGSIGRVAALSLSTVAGSWHIENQERNYTNLRTQRNLGNNCPDEVVDSLLLGVRSAGVPLCKRYYNLKKSILKQTQGLEKFRWSDRNAPIDIDGDNKEVEKISWDDCVKIVEKGVSHGNGRMCYADLYIVIIFIPIIVTNIIALSLTQWTLKSTVPFHLVWRKCLPDSSKKSASMFQPPTESRVVPIAAERSQVLGHFSC